MPATKKTIKSRNRKQYKLRVKRRTRRNYKKSTRKTTIQNGGFGAASYSGGMIPVTSTPPPFNAEDRPLMIAGRDNMIMKGGRRLKRNIKRGGSNVFSDMFISSSNDNNIVLSSANSQGAYTGVGALLGNNNVNSSISSNVILDSPGSKYV